MIKAVFFDFDGVLTLDKTGSLTTARYISVATGIDHGLAEFVVSLHIEGSGHEGRLEHAQVYTMYEHDLFRTVEQSDLFHCGEGFI